MVNWVARNRRRLSITLAALAGAAVALWLAQIALHGQYRAQLDDYVHTALIRANAVAQASADAIDLAVNETAPFCSEADLREMRYIAFANDYVYGIGRVHGNFVTCTAEWGRLTNDVFLPPPDYRARNGVALWRDMPNIIDSRRRSDLALDRGVIVFTAPDAFKDLKNSPPDRSALVLTNDHRHIYRALGKTDGLIDRFATFNADTRDSAHVMQKSCDPRFDICVLAEWRGEGILRQSLHWVALIAGGGALFAGSLAFGLFEHLAGASSLPQRVRKLVAAGRLAVVYQPLVRLSDGTIVGAEALARLYDEKNNPVPPDIFIPVAEGTPLIGDITRRIIGMAIGEMKAALRRGDFYVSVNITAEDAVSASLCSYLDEQTYRASVPRPAVVLEITERTRADPEALLAGITRLREHGYKVLIDDFGTGYSNLSYLTRLPVSGIKLDKMFTQAIGKEALTSAIVEKICQTSKDLGLRLIAEGIETPEQADYIRAHAPEALGQGWLFGKPMPAKDLLQQISPV